MKILSKFTFLTLVVFGIASAMIGCSEFQPSKKPVTKAAAQIRPTVGNQVRGQVVFIQQDEGVQIIADIDGLEPGVHGFHIHEFGDCSASDGASAGGHFNPEHKDHGAPTTKNRHVGDLGNIKGRETGHGHYSRVDMDIQLNGPNSIIGKSVIIHSKEDDFTTQPTGNAGKRVACGVIEAVE